MSRGNFTAVSCLCLIWNCISGFLCSCTLNFHDVKPLCSSHNSSGVKTCILSIRVLPYALPGTHRKLIPSLITLVQSVPTHLLYAKVLSQHCCTHQKQFLLSKTSDISSNHSVTFARDLQDLVANTDDTVYCTFKIFINRKNLHIDLFMTQVFFIRMEIS